MGDLHVGRLDIFRQKIINQEFSENLKPDDIFDIALFMLMEFSPPTPAKAVGATVAASEPDAGLPDGQDGQPAEGPAESYEAIRGEIRKEAEERLESLSEEDIEADLKVQRLRRLAKDASVKSSKTTVRRVGS